MGEIVSASQKREVKRIDLFFEQPLELELRFF